MPTTEYHEYQDSPQARDELLSFLQRTGDLPISSGTWAQRLCHWWEQNPCAADNPHRGGVMRSPAGLVGFGAVIPAAYALDGRQVPALLGSTLRVEPDHPRAVFVLLRRMQEASERFVIVHSTPIPKLQHALVKMNAVSETVVKRHYFATGAWARFTGVRGCWPELDGRMTLIQNLEECQRLARPWQRADRLEKWVSVASLRWTLATATRPLRFIGAMDAEGTLYSYLILSPKEARGLHSWEIIESFTCRDDQDEVQALAGELIRDPHLLPGRCPLLSVASFPADHTWDAMPSLMVREQQVCHFFMLPDALRAVPKLTMMAEGDVVL